MMMKKKNQEKTQKSISSNGNLNLTIIKKSYTTWKWNELSSKWYLSRLSNTKS